MSALPGIWDLDLKTPIGTLQVRYRFVASPHGIEGSATSRDETVPLTDIAVSPVTNGEHVTWQQRVTRPLRLNLAFDVLVDGDTMTGHSRAGRLPRTNVSGRRRTS